MAQAQVFKCRQGNGAPTYQDLPCEPGQAGATLHVDASPRPRPPASTPAPRNPSPDPACSANLQPVQGACYLQYKVAFDQCRSEAGDARSLCQSRVLATSQQCAQSSARQQCIQHKRDRLVEAARLSCGAAMQKWNLRIRTCRDGGRDAAECVNRIPLPEAACRAAAELDRHEHRLR